MANSEKIYVAFDAINDMNNYKKLMDFRKQDGSVFDFYNGARFAKEIDKASDEVVKASIEVPKKIQWLIEVMEEIPKGEKSK